MYYPTPLQPKQVRLELSALCNAHCFPCHGHGQYPMARPKGHMTFTLVEKCVQDIKKFPSVLSEIVPTGYGELFLHPQWVKIIEYIARELPRVRMVIPTNGTLLKDGVIETLCRIPTLKLIDLSVNAFLPETYRAFCKLPPDNLARIEEAAKKIRQLRPDITLWISAVHDATYQSPKEIELFTQHWSKYGIVQVNEASYARIPNKEPLIPVKLPCRSLFSDIVILWDGKVVTGCCFDAEGELFIGDITKDTILDLWHSKSYTKIRNLHLNNMRESLLLCRGCTFA